MSDNKETKQAQAVEAVARDEQQCTFYIDAATKKLLRSEGDHTVVDVIWKMARASDDEFKNFHRLLCERFGYSHDERDWKRDQLSLIEWIAARASEAAAGEPVAWTADALYAAIEQVLLHYRHSTIMTDDMESGYPLTDLLTMDGQSIQMGYDEIRYICDAIYNEVLTKAAPQPASEQHDTAELAGELWRAAAEKELLELARHAGERLSGPFQSGFLHCIEEIATRLYLSDDLRNYSTRDDEVSEQQTDPLRRAVKAVVAMLKNGEYAEHWAHANAKGDADASALEDVITELVSESNDSSEQQAALGLTYLQREALRLAANYLGDGLTADTLRSILAAKGDGHADK